MRRKQEREGDEEERRGRNEKRKKGENVVRDTKAEVFRRSRSTTAT